VSETKSINFIGGFLPHYKLAVISAFLFHRITNQNDKFSLINIWSVDLIKILINRIQLYVYVYVELLYVDKNQ
jgi:hypothetical protein